MARIDSFLTQLVAYEADALVVEAGDNLYLQKGDARQPLMQVRPGAIANAHVRALLDEIAPAELRAVLDRGGPCSFDYRWSSCLFKVEVAFRDERLLVRMRVIAADVEVVIVADEDDRGLARLLAVLADVGGSDLHLTPGRVPLARVDGALVPLPGAAPQDAYALQKMLEEIVPPTLRREFDDGRDVEFAWDKDGHRVRCAVFRDHSGWCAVFRRFLQHVPDLFALGLPDVVDALCGGPGLVVIAGGVGSGRSTTAAALLDRINAERAVHILTVEDPVEVVHAPKRALVHQRSVRERAQQAAAVRAAVDVDVFYLAAFDDAAVIEAALERADGGALVIATVTARSAAQAVSRIVDRVAAERREHARALLRDNLRGVLCQSLYKKRGGGRVVAAELLGRGLPALSLRDALKDLVLAGIVAAEDAAAGLVHAGVDVGHDGAAAPAESTGLWT